MKRTKTLTKLPKSLYRFFWDVNVVKLNPADKPYFVINRLLDKGNIGAVRYVNRHFDKKLIEETFIKFRDFRPKIGNFWSLLLQVPKEKIACLQPHYLKMRKQLWPY